MIDAQTTDKIRTLYQQIHTLYQEAKHRPSGNVCDICGKSDTLGKNGCLYKARAIVHGYFHRPAASPILCHAHASGWAHSHNSINRWNERSDEEVDLHFAQYLARQLLRRVK